MELMKHLKYLFVISLFFTFSCSHDSEKEISSTKNTVQKTIIETIKKDSLMINRVTHLSRVVFN